MTWLDDFATTPWAAALVVTVLAGIGWAIERWERGE